MKVKIRKINEDKKVRFQTFQQFFNGSHTFQDNGNFRPDFGDSHHCQFGSLHQDSHAGLPESGSADSAKKQGRILF